MDHAAITMPTVAEIEKAYSQCRSLFEPYKFELQQFVTNAYSLQNTIDSISGEITPEEVKLLGMFWNRSADTLTNSRLYLDETADTKRRILSSIASNYDIFQLNCPLMNRSRLFMHKLQCNSHLNWDDKLEIEQCREWRNISRQINCSPALSISRFVGNRGDNYELVAFTDASKYIYGMVLYIKNLSTNETNFLFARNKIVNKQLENKTIPNLELHAIALGVDALADCKKDLSDESNVCPVNIVALSLYSDSMVALNWISSSTLKLDKMQKKSTFVLNRLNSIAKRCDEFPVTFKFIAGLDNPADCVTREMSYKQLSTSCYLSGPVASADTAAELMYSFKVPRDCLAGTGVVVESSTGTVSCTELQCLIPLERYSSFHKLVSVHRNVLKFINNLKRALKLKSEKYRQLSCYDETANFYNLAADQIILVDQSIHFPDIFEYFQSSCTTTRDMPNLVAQLNVFIDNNGLLRVRSKFDRWKNTTYNCPLLLAKNSKLVDLILQDTHFNMAHAGVYSMLSELRKQYYVPHYFTVAKKFLRKCITCRRVNARSIKLNQSSYREFRCSPPVQPFKSIFLDHFGPYYVKIGNQKVKVWILCLTCLWSRAINLKLCYNLSVKEFLRTFQLHIFQYGLPEVVLSDLGSQLVAGSNIIKDSLNSVDTKLFLEEKGTKHLTFHHYYKGCSSLGSLVESCVKLTKRLIYGAIKSNILDAVEFDIIVAQTVHLVNKRPIAFKESLRETGCLSPSIPAPITPEVLLCGYELVSVNILPNGSSQRDPEWKPDIKLTDYIKTNFAKLNKVRKSLSDIYQNEFLSQLVVQATDNKNRYKPKKHVKLGTGDLVLLKENHTKAIDYPMAIVKEVSTNSLGEVTGATVIKGNREVVKRHSSSLILLMPGAAEKEIESNKIVESCKERLKRSAAILSQKHTKNLYDSGAV